jgi:hypothetical protein
MTSLLSLSIVTSGVCVSPFLVSDWNIFMHKYILSLRNVYLSNNYVCMYSMYSIMYVPMMSYHTGSQEKANCQPTSNEAR